MLVTVASFLLASSAAAQVFRLGSWSGSLEGVTEFTRLDTKQGTGEESRSDHVHNATQLTLRNSGMSLYDPRLVNFSLGGTFGLAQDRFSQDGTWTSEDSTLTGYDAFASVLPDQPFSLNLFANRNESVLSRELAGTSEVTTENRGASLFMRRLYVPSTLSFRQESLDEESRIANVLARRAERRNIFRYEGQRGWVDSEVDASYEFVDDTDEAFPKLSFQSHQAHLNYSLDFGDELNRRWDSRLSFTTRTGLIESTIWSAAESLRVDHTERFRSDYRYSLLRTETGDIETTTHTAAAGLRHRLYESLTTTAGLDASLQYLPQGEKDTGRGRLDFAYVKRLPLGGRLNAGLGGSLQYENDRFESSESQVSQESHTAATPAALPIALANPFVGVSSIVVTKTAVGPLPAGCIPPPGPPTPLTLGVDYNLQTSRDVTEIVPIPCAGVIAGINPGDTIAVDYRFTVAPSLAFTTRSWHADLGVDYRWIRVFLNHAQSNQDLVSGRDDRFLNDEQSDTVGAELRYDGGRLHASLLGEARRFTSTRVRYDSLRTIGRADLTIVTGLVLGANVERTVTEFPDQNRETESRAGRLSLTYAYGSSLFVTASGGVRRLTDTSQPTDQTTEARLSIRWLYRKIEVAPTFEFFERERGDTDTKEYRALLKTIRRF